MGKIIKKHPFIFGAIVGGIVINSVIRRVSNFLEDRRIIVMVIEDFDEEEYIDEEPKSTTEEN